MKIAANVKKEVRESLLRIVKAKLQEKKEKVKLQQIWRKDKGDVYCR